MKEVCEKTGFSYETIKFYCNEGLIPNVKRDSRNRRVFDDRDIAWIKDLHCLKKCHMSLKEMKQYMDWCLEGPKSLQIRKDFLEMKKEELRKEIEHLEEGIDYINYKQGLYDDFISGKTPYYSNIIDVPGNKDRKPE